ncbi:MAG: ZIP family magnesium transporter [Gemmatimonadetes bacterium]|nr:MAG: ZIP family magnesium transporter [Gemmatimonadota bacterium]
MTDGKLWYAIAAAGANLLGAVAVTWRSRWSTGALDAMLAFAAGFMIAVALIDLFPEALTRGGPRAAIVALVGYLAVHLTQHVIGTHFHFGEETHHVSEAVSVAALVGLLLHTFVDGVAVASGLDVGGALGALVFLAVILHKVPEGLAISSLFLAAGQGRRRALLAAAALGAATIAGVALTSRVAALREHGLALAAGVTLYVGMSNLVPEFRARGGWRLSVAFVGGSAVYFAARAIVGA